MTKTKMLKKYINIYNIIFDRILNNYKLNRTASLFHDYLEYKSSEGTIQISLENDYSIKVLKKENDKKNVELITFEYDEIVSKEKVRNGNIKEDITRTYQENKLVSLDSLLTLKATTEDETIIKIHIDKDKVLVNERDITPLYKNYHNDLEKKYTSLKNNYCISKNPERVFTTSQNKLTKSRRQLAIEEQIRNYIREEFDYQAPLEKRNLEELVKILNMLIKRNEYQEPKVKQYKKTNN